MDWAVPARERAFDELMPIPLNGGVTLPICRTTVIRSPGASDEFEFAFSLTEKCDGGINGTFVLPVGSPITEQLARLKLSNPQLSEERAIALVNVNRVVLDPKVAASVLNEIAALQMSALPPTNVFLHARNYELVSSSGMYSFYINITEGDRDRTRGKFLAIVHRLLDSVVKTPEMPFDVSWWAAPD